MSGGLAPRSAIEFAIDSALVRHVGGLLDKYASDIELELSANPEELSTSATPSARARVERKLDIAILAHSNMMEIVKRKQS